MLDTQAKAAPPDNRARKILLRIAGLLLLAVVIGSIEGYAVSLSNRSAHPAGFARGVVHGALMPAALPNLLVGRDITIYATVNTGRTYKLGYTVGVNGCGAIFFGIFFWRLSRWRRRGKLANSMA
jgi:hypothetical protein